MAMRNFWIRAAIDGRANDLQGGPMRKDGGFSVTVYVRNAGESVRALDISGRADDEGHLTLWVRDGETGTVLASKNYVR
jgi:hypothetical protein